MSIQYYRICIRASKRGFRVLFVSYHTVNTHLKNIYKKLQISTSEGAVSKVVREKLLSMASPPSFSPLIHQNYHDRGIELKIERA